MDRQLPETRTSSHDERPCMQRRATTIADTLCVTYASENPRHILLQPVDHRDLDDVDREAQLLQDSCKAHLALVAFEVPEWNDDLSPWEAPPAFGKRGFGSGAQQTLDLILNGILPELSTMLRPQPGHDAILGGYSLAALFSLWCSYHTDAFAAVAAASPSVWFPGWIDYAEGHQPYSRAVYLSLGDREERTRNAVVSTVGSCIRRQHELLRAQGVSCTLGWNAGSHFQDPDSRTARAFLWCVDALEAERTA